MIDLKAFEAIVPNNFPKLEINHIFMDKENVVATDTKMLLMQPHSENVEDSFLIINNKVKKDTLAAQEVKFGLPVNTVIKGYPTYKRIIPKEFVKYQFNEEGLIEAMYRLTRDEGIVFDYIGLATKFKKLDKLLGDVVEFSFSGKNAPAAFKFRNSATFVIMPFAIMGDKQ